MISAYIVIDMVRIPRNEPDSLTVVPSTLTSLQVCHKIISITFYLITVRTAMPRFKGIRQGCSRAEEPSDRLRRSACS